MKTTKLWSLKVTYESGTADQALALSFTAGTVTTNCTLLCFIPFRLGRFLFLPYVHHSPRLISFISCYRANPSFLGHPSHTEPFLNTNTGSMIHHKSLSPNRSLTFNLDTFARPRHVPVCVFFMCAQDAELTLVDNAAMLL